MHSKVTVVASVVLLVAGSWWWMAQDPPLGLPEAEEALGVGGERHEQRADSKQELSSRKPSPPNPSRTRTVMENEALESEVARSRSPTLGTPVTLEGREPAIRAGAVDAGDRGGAVDDSEGAGGSEDFVRFKQLLGELIDSFQETPGDDPIEPDAAGLYPEDVDRLDLDGDRMISPWEIERARRRLERAEFHPVRNDLGDGAFPVERGEYRRPEWEFDAVDANGDGLIDVEEYYEFLVDVDEISLHLDADGDRQISRYESGLTEDEFATLNLDDSGSLQPWEIHRAVLLGALD